MEHSQYQFYLHEESASAMKFSETMSTKAFWVPRSLIKYIRKTGNFERGCELCLVQIPDWKATQLGIEQTGA